MLLQKKELIQRARTLCLVLTDCDGVLTDTGVFYSERGEELKRFSVRDGMGVALLREAGIETGILTGESSPPLARRADKLGITTLFQGIRDKRQCLTDILEHHNLALSQIAYIGDDINDLAIIKALNTAGLTGAPADAIPRICRSVHYQCSAPGGHGAFREFADWLIALRQEITETMTLEPEDPRTDPGISSPLQYFHGGHRAETTHTRR